MSSIGRDLHGKSEQARERGDVIEALKLSDEALIAYQEENDWFGFCDILSSRVLSFRHLFEKTDCKQYLVVAKHTALAAVEIAQDSDDPSIAMMPYSKLGRIHEDLNEFSEASIAYEKAVDLMISHPPKEHNRPAVLADLKIHLEAAKYKSGDKSALARMEEALSELEKSDEEKYNKDVWRSGAHMRIADMLREDDVETAKKHLATAKEIIDANQDLKLRSGQWTKLAAKF